MKSISGACFPPIIKINATHKSDKFILNFKNKTREMENWKIKNIFPN
jgi:hypothetical protein